MLCSEGNGLICFTLTGKDYYPTAAYTTIQGDGTLCNDVFISGLGKAPLDDYDGEPWLLHGPKEQHPRPGTSSQPKVLVCLQEQQPRIWRQ